MVIEHDRQYRSSMDTQYRGDMDTSISTTLTFVVPTYNMEEYLERCVNSLTAIANNRDIEVIIVDDGSTDSTPRLADIYAKRQPNIVHAIHQPNKGHGGAVNTGIAHAHGTYVKVVDADDWIDPESLVRVMRVLRGQCRSFQPVDMLVTDYVYDKTSKRVKHVVHFDHVMQPGKTLSWDDLGHFGVAQYMIMHALIFRTDVIRQSGMTLPEHTYYVDFIYAYQPLPWVHTLMYLDTPFYHYVIGRSGQSVATNAMIRRVDQLRRVNEIMAKATPEPGTVPDGLYKYMIHFLAINSMVTSVFLILSQDPKNYQVKDALWKNLDEVSPRIGHDVRKKLTSRAINLPGRSGRTIVRYGYRLAEGMIGFN